MMLFHIITWFLKCQIWIFSIVIYECIYCKILWYLHTWFQFINANVKKIRYWCKWVFFHMWIFKLFSVLAFVRGLVRDSFPAWSEAHTWPGPNLIPRLVCRLGWASEIILNFLMGQFRLTNKINGVGKKTEWTICFWFRLCIFRNNIQ